VCKQGLGMSTHRPVRYRFKADPEYLYCGWPVRWTVIRVCLSIGFVLVCVAGIFGMVCVLKCCIVTQLLIQIIR
jgi:hypothetical protein